MLTRSTLDLNTEFPASVSANSLLAVSRAMKLGPVLFTQFVGLGCFHDISDFYIQFKEKLLSSTKMF